MIREGRNVQSGLEQRPAPAAGSSRQQQAGLRCTPLGPRISPAHLFGVGPLVDQVPHGQQQVAAPLVLQPVQQQAQLGCGGEASWVRAVGDRS